MELTTPFNTTTNQLELAEQLMALYRNLTGDKHGCDADDLEGIMELMKVWAKSTGYKLEWSF